jgi:holo-[acyl-carrier protein] synthase
MTDGSGAGPTAPIVRVGTDVQSIARFREQPADVAEGVRDRVFTADERSYCEGTNNPAQHYAARWAAKEAFIKTLDPEETISMDAVAVDRAADRPSLELAPDARDALAATLRAAGGSDEWRTDVSLSHDSTSAVAMATVVVTANAGDGDIR